MEKLTITKCAEMLAAKGFSKLRELKSQSKRYEYRSRVFQKENFVVILEEATIKNDNDWFLNQVHFFAKVKNSVKFSNLPSLSYSYCATDKELLLNAKMMSLVTFAHFQSILELIDDTKIENDFSENTHYLHSDGFLTVKTILSETNFNADIKAIS